MCVLSSHYMAIEKHLSAGDPVSIPGSGMLYCRCKKMSRYIRDFLYLCLSDEALKTAGHFYMVAMPGEVKHPTQRVNVYWDSF